MKSKCLKCQELNAIIDLMAKAIVKAEVNGVQVDETTRKFARDMLLARDERLAEEAA